MRSLFGAIILSVFLLSSADDTQAFKLPHTGQTTCYDGAGIVITCPSPGQSLAQDGSYIINPLSYIDNGDGTVADNNTGLIWQKQDDGNFHTWDESVTYCGSLSLGGQTDWRLPSKKELVGIVDYNIPYPGPTIAAVFSNTHPDPYWTSTVSASNSGQAAAVLFFVGYAGYADKQSSVFPFPPLPDFHCYARCVRGGQYPQQQLTDNGNGTVTDAASGLVWQQADPGLTTWDSALSYCQELSLAGNTDWRLPNIKEIESLTDDTRLSPAIDNAIFLNAQSDRYWSSTTDITAPSYAFTVDFVDGHLGDRVKDSLYDPFYTRCVRAGQFGALYKLDIALSGDGTGTVSTNPTSINCGSGCSALFFPSNSVVTFEAISSTGSSVFSGWGGDADCLDGQVTMSADKNCTATFSTCTTDIAQIGATTYSSIGVAYTNASSIEQVTIDLISYNTTEAPTFSSNKDIILHGGFDCGFTLQPFSYTVLGGPLIVSGGSVTMENIVIQ